MSDFSLENLEVITPTEGYDKQGLKRRYGSAVYFSAPMTHASGATFRQMIRMAMGQEDDRYVGYTQMYGADAIIHNEALRTAMIRSVLPTERVMLQLCGKDPASFIEALQIIKGSQLEPSIIGIDINLGCPASCASSRHYGLYVSRDWPLVYTIISSAVKLALFPITCKIRPLTTPEETADYLYLLYCSGVAGVTLHMRHTTRPGHKAQSIRPCCEEIVSILALMKKRHPNAFDLDGRLKLWLTLNGGIKGRAEADLLLSTLPIDGVMVGVGFLKSPYCLSKISPPTSWILVAEQYLDLYEEIRDTPSYLDGCTVIPAASFKEVTQHVMKLVQNVNKRYNVPLSTAKTIAEVRDILRGSSS
ncbi:tRNA-dihydrouridine synthase 1 [Giardia muris]|uniref:tRNA-dihydrouridine synthase 1 n=1 Tax=Giardia muris TaxID=5742 RepID=A0A4Z1T3V2_GIAMU|nr:tRNA-dihydrouridine synthase 1 [Giardia muris]|eukprot:TNJ27081.1 tRNA-dihydrouridine synthase 1 [Giardia muris]